MEDCLYTANIPISNPEKLYVCNHTFIHLGASVNCQDPTGTETHTQICGNIFTTVIDYPAYSATEVAATTICGKYFIKHNHMDIKQSSFNIQGPYLPSVHP